MKRAHGLWALFLFAAGCRTTHSAPLSKPPEARPAELGVALPMPAGLDAAAMDPSVSPCDDFYAYACGGWLKAAVIPADLPAWSRGFAVIHEKNEAALHSILEAVKDGPPPAPTPYAHTLGELYAGCMDLPQHERALPAVRKQLASLVKTGSPAALAGTLAHLHREGVDSLFGFDSTQDAADATQEIGEVDQGGLGMPDRDYYLSDAPDKKTVRARYADHVEAMFRLLGEAKPVAHRDAERVLGIELRLARASDSKVHRRDPHQTYHRLDRQGLARAAPGFPWDAYFRAEGMGEVTALNVTYPPFFREVSAMMKEVPAADWRAYLTYHYLNRHVLALPKAFEDESFRFEQALSGEKEDRPRWKKCVSFADHFMGEALGVPFVEETFGADGKAKALEVVHAVEGAFESNLTTLDWMDAPTRTQALVKLKQIVNKIGYPDHWRKYDKLQADRGDFLSALDSAVAFEHHRRLAKIGKPVDRTEWEMSPPTVNAYYSPPTNDVVFPAGILQPPFFSRGATYPVTFGGIGMVVGHEFTHGFDDEGAQFDGKGNLRNWWTPASSKAFHERTQCVKRQFDEAVAVDDLHVNGALTLGENVADLGGLKLAHAAMQSWVQAHPQSVGHSRFTPEQQFFLGFAQSWCERERPEFRRMLVAVDPHSPPRLRVNEPLSNLPSFRAAFQCPAGSPMVRPEAKACQVW